MKTLLLFFSLIVISCGPSCEDLGGRLEYTHTILIPTKVGSVTMMQQHPQYQCVMPGEGETD